MQILSLTISIIIDSVARNENEVKKKKNENEPDQLEQKFPFIYRWLDIIFFNL